jgi:hypothetical protein
MHKYVVMAHAENPVSKAEEIRQAIEPEGSMRTTLIVDDHSTEGLEDQRYDIISIFTFGEELDQSRKSQLDELLASLGLATLDTVIGDDETELGHHVAQS